VLRVIDEVSAAVPDLVVRVRAVVRLRPHFELLVADELNVLLRLNA